MREDGLEEEEAYIPRRKKTVAQYISMNLCKEEEIHPGARVSKRWWKQEGLSPVVEQEAASMKGETDEDY